MRLSVYSLIFLVVSSCGFSEEEKDLNINLIDPVYYKSLTQPDSSFASFNVKFANSGATIGQDRVPSYILIENLEFDLSENLAISCWFKFIGEDGTKEQMLFQVMDTVGKSMTFYIAGRRLTGQVGSQHLWAKGYDYTAGATSEYYDLFRLERGKYYFLVINFQGANVELNINGEEYASYQGVYNNFNRSKKLFLGVKHIGGEQYDYQWEGSIRNLTIYDRSLNFKEIEALGAKHFEEIYPYNDAFELSKFKIEDTEE